MNSKCKYFSKLIVCLIALPFAAGISSCDKEDGNHYVSFENDIEITLNTEDFDLYIGHSQTITASVSIPGVSITWSSGDTEVATVKNGKVHGISEGYAEIIASVGLYTSTSVFVHVTEEPIIIDERPTITINQGYEELVLFVGENPTDSKLTEGLVGKDYLGNSLEVEVVNKDNLDSSKLGTYSVSYKVKDNDNNLETTISRNVKVTYFGIEKGTLDSLETSSLSSWTYTADADHAISANEWKKQIVPGHNADWNKFEGPYDEETDTYMNCIIMHGSDTNGHGRDGEFEEEDENPNTILFNKVTIDADKTVLNMQCSVNPYPDYNNMISKFRYSIMNPTTYEVTHFDYRTMTAPLTSGHDGLDYSKVRNGMFDHIDLSQFAGQTVIVMIEQDSSTIIYQDQYYKDIGYLDFQIPTLINETRDTFVIYGMSFVDAVFSESICSFNDTEWRALPIDSSTSWGICDTTNPNFGLRNDHEAMAKWSWYLPSGKGSYTNKNANYYTQFVSFADMPSKINDLEPEQCIANKFVATENYFLLRAGTDTDSNTINVRFNVIDNKGNLTHIAPCEYTENEYTPLSDSWGRIQKSQWVYGTKLVYDISEFKNKTITVVIETDQAAEYNPTIWIDAMALVGSK